VLPDAPAQFAWSIGEIPAMPTAMKTTDAGETPFVAVSWLVMSEVTRILSQIEQGDSSATEQLLPIVYDELRKLAAAKLTNEKPGQTIQATALVHDAFIRLVDQKAPQQWDNSRHFFSAAAEAMRRILIERARQRSTLKRGGDRDRIEMASVDPAVLPLACDDILGLDEALEKLERQHPRKAELVKLRFFAGLTTAQAASGLGISTSTAENDWAYARSWLRLEISGSDKD
jgi:RNA polymerase sigma factor (TIGR02999 family)